MTGTIVKFEAGVTQSGVYGIKGGRGYSNESALGGYYNGAGAFMNYPERHLYVYWRTETGKLENMDVRNYVKSHMTGRTNITQKYIDQLTDANKGKVVDLDWNREWDMRVLKDVSQITVV